MTKEQAIALADSKWWVGVSAHDIVMFQLFEPLLCMDFSTFHKAVETALDRPVWTHEFASSNVENLKKEFLGDRHPPMMEEIINLIPQEKRVLLIIR